MCGVNILKKVEASSAQLLESMITESLEDDKAENIVAIDLRGKASFADGMVIASGRSQRHIASIADHLVERLRDKGIPDVKIEGKNGSDWVLVDCHDIIVHIFKPEVRDFYNLERMWQN